MFSESVKPQRGARRDATLVENDFVQTIQRKFLIRKASCA
jgi:hypothetical protein